MITMNYSKRLNEAKTLKNSMINFKLYLKAMIDDLIS